MKESFDKFKNKIILEVLIKSILLGISLGLLAFSIPWIYIKSTGIEFNVLYLVVIGVLTAVIFTGCLFLILKPSKLKIAKRIDKQLNLNEKVQTMIEYEKEDNFMIEIQREHTLSILSNISIKNLSMKFGIFCFIILFIASATCITAVAIPKYQEPPVEAPVDPDYDPDNWTILALRALIEVVSETDFNESLKTKYIDMLEGLIEDLENNIDKESQMKEAVTSIISKIELELDKVNSNNEIYTVLRDSNNSFVSSLAVKINLLNITDIENLLDGIIILISGDELALDEFKIDFVDAINKSLLNKEDSLVKSLLNLGNNVYNCKGESDINFAVTEVVNRDSLIVLDVIKEQRENYNISKFVISELKNIFSLEDLEDEKEENNNNSNDDSQNPGDDEDDDKTGVDQDGGLGTGDIIFGSDDMFFDPESGSVNYGDVITKYYGDILGKLNDGTLPEELREYFNYYFKLLFGDLENENGE